MSVVSIHGRDAGAFAKSILHQLLEGGHVAGRDADGRNVLQLSVEDWLLEELCAFDTDSAELEDADGEAEPDEEVDGQAMVPDLVPLKRIVRASRLARGPALGVLRESEPDEQVAGPATVLDFVLPKRVSPTSRVALALPLALLLVTAPGWPRCSRRSGMRDDAAALDRGDADVPPGPQAEQRACASNCVLKSSQS